ncbi:hypothetical protein EXU57_14820 [Segetibacter sp. 3557_3]|uniref:hypothetical protein n=1 Tax=Segetibacter sp. 3557_3 TaxID=2547429 RepID=UPI001058CFFA|nr:hypothetical protein [Segetibacter sp. 3557_3]TDH24610.1 hypothetical protein EXU57_14820 [Segetibacter sp. 3557_3]
MSKAEYAFTDRQPYALNYYRISQTDTDGQSKYFSTVTVKLNPNKELEAMHYVQQDNVYVQVAGATPGKGSLVLYNKEGKKLASQSIMMTNDVSTYKIEKPVRNGVYLLSVESNGRKLYNAKVMIF